MAWAARLAVALWWALWLVEGYDPSPLTQWSRMENVLQPGQGKGGEPLSVQPCVALLDMRGRLVNTSANSVYDDKFISARFLSSKLPVNARYAILRQEGKVDPLIDPIAPMVEGWANFSGLYINELAEGFEMNIYSIDFGVQLTSEKFDNVLGDPFEMKLIYEPGTATGGVAFLPQPTIGIVDRGGNPIDWLSSGTVTVTVCQESDGCPANPGGQLVFTDVSSSLTVEIIGGQAIFTGLAIDKAGYPYRLKFDTDYGGIPVTSVTSNPFTVGVGLAVEIRMEAPVTGAQGGMPFAGQPRVSLRDAGGNLVTEDALAPPYSEVQLYLSNNPTSALLASATHPARSLPLAGGYSEGVDFRCDKIGQGFQIRFTAIMRTASGYEYSLYADSAPFDVVLGEPSQLTIARPISGAYAGGLPFYNQPIIQLEDGGGNVFLAESSATVTATLVETPTGQPLLGVKEAVFFKGQARFRSLKLLQVAQGYKVLFETTVDGTDLAVNLTFDVLPSAEFEVMADDAEWDDRYGHSVSIFDETLISGAPLEDLSVFEVQRVTSTADSLSASENEVQQVKIKGSHLNEIQTVTSCGSGGPSTSIGGYFVLSMEGMSTRPLRYDVHASVLKTYLEMDIPLVETVTVEKTGNDACDTLNAYRWTIYFDTREGEIPPFDVNWVGVVTTPSPDPNTFRYSATEFTGMQSASSASSVTVSVATIQDSPKIDGTFRLVVGGDGTQLGDDVVSVETTDLAWDATALEVKNAVEQAVRSLSSALQPSAYSGFNLVDVVRSGPSGQGGYTWDLVFPTTPVYRWRQVSTNVSGLSGLGVEAKVQTTSYGKAPLGGHFRLWFKGSGPTAPLAFDATDAEVKSALEALPTADEVSVVREVSANGFTWVITFIRTRTQTLYGFKVDDPYTNQPPLMADTFGLKGSGAEVVIEYAYAVDDIDTLRCGFSQGIEYDMATEPTTCKFSENDRFLLPEDMPVMGKAGDETGSAYIVYYDHASTEWRQAAKLQASDREPYDNFGWSVSYDNSTTALGTRTGVAVVGAPYSSQRGESEVQSIVCTADSGELAFRFRSVMTGYIAHDATRAELEAALESIASITDLTVTYHLGSLEEADILDLDAPNGLCQPQSELGTPTKIYAKVAFIYPRNGDLPLIEAVTSDAKVLTQPTLLDSSAPTGMNGHRHGQVAIEELVKGTISGKLTGEEGYNSGAAYVFLPVPPADPANPHTPESAVTRGWAEDAKIMSADGQAGDSFGYCVSVYIDTIAIGAPEHDWDVVGGTRVEAAGAVYVYTRDGQGGAEVGVWTQQQKLIAPDRQPGDKLGSVLLLKEDSIIASALGRNSGTGRVYIFKRAAINLPFTFNQALSPSAGRPGEPGDGFGSSLAYYGNTLAIGAQYANGPPNQDNSDTIKSAGKDRFSGRSRAQNDGTGLERCGIVYSYTRFTYDNAFTFHQLVVPRTRRAHARFGHSMSLERDLLLVTEQEEYIGELASRRYIFKLVTQLSDEGKAQDPNRQIGNRFALSWRARESKDSPVQNDVTDMVFSNDPYDPAVGGVKKTVLERQFDQIVTSWMPYDISAEEMQFKIFTELDTGDVLVTRTDPDFNGGHTWLITFVDLSSVGGKVGSIPELEVISELSGGGQVSVEALQKPSPYVHGMAHVFKRKPADAGDWAPHAVLRPEVQQDGDQFGASLSMRGRYAVVGAPNRDAYEVTGSNAGAAYVFDIGFVNIKFDQQSYTVAEDGQSTTIAVSRCKPKCDVGIAPTPGPLMNDFAMDEVNDIQFVLADGTARSRPDCKLDSKGTEECLWLDSEDHSWNVGRIVPNLVVDIPDAIPEFLSPAKEIPYRTLEKSDTYSKAYTSGSVFHKYDFRAQNDYPPKSGQLQFAASEKDRDFEVIVTNDGIYESPDETINLLLFSAGMRPLPGGDYWSVLTIEDDGDGGVGSVLTYEQVYAEQPSTKARYGSATSMAGDISVITAPFEESGGKSSAGGMYVYRHTALGVWELEEHITSPNAHIDGRFGTSVQTKDLGPHRIIVGAPGENPPAAYIYMRVPDDPLNPAPIDGPGSWQLEASLLLDPQVVYDPRCDPASSGFMQRCKNDHHPINADASFAGENAVAISSSVAIVGAKGLEAAFVYKMKTVGQWYFFQMLKSPEYQDEMFPMDSEHRKVYVKRDLFGSSVAVDGETLVVGATLADSERYEDPDQLTDQDVGLGCSDLGFRTSPTQPQVYMWELNQYGNAYSWAPASDDQASFAYQWNTGGSAFQSTVSCEETNAFLLTIRSSGIPDHAVGRFPMAEDSLYAGQPDNAGAIVEQEHVFHMPRFPNVTVVNPVSVVQSKHVLPPGPIGYALNGVPFISPYNEEGDDTTVVESIGFSGSVSDLCNGVTVNITGYKDHLGREVSPREHVYAYRGNPLCLYPQPPEITSPQLNTGKLHPFVYDKSIVTNPNPGQRSPKIGYALDGFAIYGPFAEDGNLPTDLDVCNGRFDTQLGTYVYHITPWKEPYIIGCLRGKLTVEVPQISNPFPEFMYPGASSKPRDLSFYGRGAAYLFMFRSLQGDPFTPTRLNGMDISPQQDPVTGADATFAWRFHDKIVAEDAQQRDRFGHAIMLSSDQLVISAYMENAKARSTWDWETGDLRGWTKTGTAFDNQPTFGDNTAHRNVYGDILVSTFRDYEGKTYHGSSNREGERIDIYEDIEGEDRTVVYGHLTTHRDHPYVWTLPAHELREAMWSFVPGAAKSSNLKGKFFIGTFENRPAVYNHTTKVFESQEAQGATQGDEPQGSLLSDVFTIYGTKMSFLIGGGCDIDTEYLELLVDGMPVRRVTGQCSEAMREVVWNLSTYRWQAGQIRIVDQSSSRWGHINVDDIRFNWDLSYELRSATPSGDGTDRRAPRGGATGYAGEPMAGSVYVFRRRSASKPDHPCEIDCNKDGCYFLSTPVDRTGCVWEQQQKLQPSDRRAYEKFGWSISIDDSEGLIVVGSVDGRVVDQYNHDDMGGNERAGALYIFKRVPEVRTEFGTLVSKPYWLPTELVKFQHPDKSESGHDQFAHSLSLSGHKLVVGAPKKPALGTFGAGNVHFNADSLRLFPSGGSAFFIDASITNVYFKQKEYVVVENHQTLHSAHNRILIQVRRSGDLSKTLHVSYFTSDLTANGISEARAAYCLGLYYADRGAAHCGDYVQQSGVVTFNPDDDEVEFEIRTMNDKCNEHYSEYVRLQLGIPGGPALLGEPYVAKLRIDDDDGEELVNKLFCPQASTSVSRTHPSYSHVDTPDTRGTPAREEPVALTEKTRWVLEKV